MTCEEELRSLVDSLVASSVRTHEVLGSKKSETIQLAQAAERVMSRLGHYESALKSIASSSCCDRCNEAKLVAQAALAYSTDQWSN